MYKAKGVLVSTSNWSKSFFKIALSLSIDKRLEYKEVDYNQSKLLQQNPARTIILHVVPKDVQLKYSAAHPFNPIWSPVGRNKSCRTKSLVEYSRRVQATDPCTD